MTRTSVKPVQFGLHIPVERDRFAGDPFEGQVWSMATFEDRFLDRG